MKIKQNDLLLIGGVAVVGLFLFQEPIKRFLFNVQELQYGGKWDDPSMKSRRIINGKMVEYW